MNDFNVRGSHIPYSHPDDNPQMHAEWILSLMRCSSSPPPYLSTSSSEDEDEKTPVLLELNQALSQQINQKFKYVSKKGGKINYSDCGFHFPNSDSDCGFDFPSSGSDSSGSGSSVYSSGSRYGSDCGSDCDSDCENCTQMKVYIPVSCSKKCKRCFGLSPGCGRNYGFKNIRRGLILDNETKDYIRRKSSEIIPLLHDDLRLIIKI
jgi:hypothetical protein